MVFTETMPTLLKWEAVRVRKSKSYSVLPKRHMEDIKAFKANNRVGDVGFAIQQYTEKQGYGVVRRLVGHGLGRTMHEGPKCPITAKEEG